MTVSEVKEAPIDLFQLCSVEVMKLKPKDFQWLVQGHTVSDLAMAFVVFL